MVTKMKNLNMTSKHITSKAPSPPRASSSPAFSSCRSALTSGNMDWSGATLLVIVQALVALSVASIIFGEMMHL